MSITRRDALKTLGAIAGGAAAAKLLPACGGGGPGQIDTLIFMLMENRTYDHYLGARSLMEGKPGDGLKADMANDDKDGNSIKVFPSTADLQCVLDPPHDWDLARTQFDSGKNDGFAQAFQQAHAMAGGAPVMSYQLRQNLPVLWALADEYATCDRWFASLLGPTLPNRMYWHAATSNGAKANGDVIAGAFKGVRTIYHALEEAGIDWAYYYGDIPIVSFIDGIDLTGKIKRFNPDFLDDAEKGKLPPVVYIDPAFSGNDDHPPHHPLLGEQLISAVYTSLAIGPHWPRSLFVISYDEHGGFFDHVPPGKAPDERAADGFDQLGFRVPAFVIGPYVKKGFVSSVPRDHTSPLKHIENHFKLPALTMRDAAANDLSELIDTARLAAGQASSPIMLPAVMIDEAALPDSCKAGSDVRKLDHDILAWADADPARLGDLDRRRYVREDILGIADYLERHGLGGIRRAR